MANKIKLSNIIEYCNSIGYLVDGVEVTADKLVYEERVKMNCFYCGKYNYCWKCPPKIPNIDFNKMVCEFDDMAFIFIKKEIKKNGSNYDTVRNESSVELHRALLECEKYLWNNNNSVALSFIGGSCKLCKNGCAPNRCANPYQSRTPVEALGINVVKSASNVGVSIDFPPKDYMIRMGMLLW